MAPRSSKKRDEAEPRGRGGDIVFPYIEEYLESLETTRDAVLAEMERQAHAGDFPIVGPLVGRMLRLLARSIGAKRIMELGSGFGYSGCWFARAVPEDGELILTEGSAKNMAQAREFFRQGGVRCRVRFESDNMLWGGRVVNDASHATTRGVLELTRLLFQAPKLYTMILPIRDGVSAGLKLE